MASLPFETPRLGPGDAGFWMILALWMLTGAITVNVAILIGDRKK